jgi:hypothetical protein
MSKKQKPPDQRGNILTALQTTLETVRGPVAIGLDMAAQEGEWGICVLVLDQDLQSAQLCTLLPQAKINKNHSRSPTLLFRPSLDLVENLLASIRTDKRRCGSIAVDTPLGWSCSQSRFLNGWFAEDGWHPPAENPNAELPSAQDFARRRCDLALNAAYPNIQPLAVGADKIALASVAWATARRSLAPHLGPVDLGLHHNGPGFFTFETYPGAFVKLIAPEFGDYKMRPDVRGQLLALLLDQYYIELGEHGQENLQWACTQSGSPNAFDSFLAALSAWDHIRWRMNPNLVTLSTPTFLLRAPPDPNIVDEIRKEGWILVRTNKHGSQI